MIFWLRVNEGPFYIVVRGKGEVGVWFALETTCVGNSCVGRSLLGVVYIMGHEVVT